MLSSPDTFKGGRQPMKPPRPLITLPDGTPHEVPRLLTHGDKNAKLRRSNVLSDGDDNTKLRKSNRADAGYLTFGLSLAPAWSSGYNVCSHATTCADTCIFYAGRARFPQVQDARIARTRLLFEKRAIFLAMLEANIDAAQRKAERRGLVLAVRLNVFSDRPWERTAPELFANFPRVQFYDYTKVPGRNPPSNYDLTFSRSESNEADCLAEFGRGLNVAVVFAGDKPALWHGIPVVSGDANDLRFLDPRGVVIGLKARGRALSNPTPFVVR